MTNVASVQDTLRRLFDAIMREAARDPALAQRLAEAIGQLVPAPPSASKPRRKTVGALDVHAVNILRLHGEGALRGRLEQVRAVEDLKSVAKASGLVLSGSAAKAKPSRAELIEGIVEAAKHYDRQRSAATA
jgi:hypothetical protein